MNDFFGLLGEGAPGDALHELGDQTVRPEWLKGDPDLDLLPRLRVACDLPGSPWRLRGTMVLPGSVYAVDVEHARPRSPRLLADAIELLAAVAGPAFFVRHTDAFTFDCVTGTLHHDTPEPGHGHLLRLRLTAPGSDRYPERRTRAHALVPAPDPERASAPRFAPIPLAAMAGARGAIPARAHRSGLWRTRRPRDRG